MANTVEAPFDGSALAGCSRTTVRGQAPNASAIAVTAKVTQNAGHTLEPEEGWPAEGKGVAELPSYTFPAGPSKYLGLAPTYRKAVAEARGSRFGLLV